MNKSFSFLLVDDDEDDRDLFEMAATALSTPVKITGMDNAKQAMSYLSSCTKMPDAIFIDLNMPKIDGRTFLKELKAVDNIKHIPVAIISTSAAARDISEARQLGADDFIVKPPDTDLLTNLLDNFIKTTLNNKQHEK